MKWTEQAWEKIENKYIAILQMPFIQELGSGSLARDKFQFYMAQDALYLEHFGRALALIGSRETVEIAMAATLPCFWIYKKVGDHILGNQQAGDNPYQRWIDTYGGNEFATAVQLAIDICDKAAENTTSNIRDRMTEAFITSTRMEYDFWEAAYELKVWK